MKEKTKRYIIAYLLMPLLLFFLWFVVGLLVNLWLRDRDKLDWTLKAENGKLIVIVKIR